MVRRKVEEDFEPLPPPATTLEGREEQLIAAAMDLVETRIRSGNASAQETVHFLRLGSVKNQLEQDKLRHENEVLKTRVKEMESRRSSEDLYRRALAAMRGYQGLEPREEDQEDDDPDVY
jgi:cell shape-determining protein MreC